MEQPTLESTILHSGAVAVVTGAASGIGLAAAKQMAKEGLAIVLVDVAPLDDAVADVRAVGGDGEVVPVRCDVSQIDVVVALRERVLDQFGEVHLLLNNAGVSRPTPAFSLTRELADVQRDWAQVLGTNMQGIINVAQAFAPIMARQENASVIINTGSKQGLTTPPGNAGYNVSKAAVKVYTEQLAYELRNTPDSSCTAHLFIPGWTFTGMSKSSTKPPGAWTPEQTVEYMFEKVLIEGDFYVICPDNETTVAVDKARIQWAMGDMIENRPALSRWHPAYEARFDEFVTGKQGLSARSRSRGRALERIPDVPTNESSATGPA